MLFSNNRKLLDSLWGSTIGYPSDSVASCQNSFTATISRKFAKNQSLNIPLYLT